VSVNSKKSLNRTQESNESIQHLQDSNNKLHQEVERVTADLRILNTELFQTQSKLDEKTSSNVQKDKQIVELKSMLLEYENLNNQVETRIQALNRNESSLSNSHEHAQNTIKKLEGDLKAEKRKTAELMQTLKLYDQDKDT